MSQDVKMVTVCTRVPSDWRSLWRAEAGAMDMSLSQMIRRGVNELINRRNRGACSGLSEVPSRDRIVDEVGPESLLEEER